MDNHYHLVIETQKPNLAQGMRQLNGVYTQAMNRRHGHTGHLFQGRYKSILVDKNAYFAAVIRHAVLNLVRTGTVEDPADWLWSSHRATAGQTTVPDWLSTEAVLNIFERQGDAACRRYRDFVLAGIDQDSIWSGLRQQIYLGDNDFIRRMQAHVSTDTAADVPRTQRPPAPPLEHIATRYRSRDAAILAAYATGAYSKIDIARFYGLHPATIGRIVKRRCAIVDRSIASENEKAG